MDCEHFRCSLVAVAWTSASNGRGSNMLPASTSSTSVEPHCAKAAQPGQCSVAEEATCGSMIGHASRARRTSFTAGLPASHFQSPAKGMASTTLETCGRRSLPLSKRVEPSAFVAENVPGLLNARFSPYVRDMILAPLSGAYQVRTFRVLASDFGVPQVRKRVFFVGFRSSRAAADFCVPMPTHNLGDDLFERTDRTAGARSALGLPDIGFDCCAPTIRSGFTGPRNSTSILNSKASQRVWNQLMIWPNGVQRNREAAASFPPENGHHRLAVQDCALLQGFPQDWQFAGAAYQVIGQIGNSVCPPVGYAVAKSVALALGAAVRSTPCRDAVRQKT